MLALPCLGASGSAAARSAPRAILRIWYATDDPVERVWSQELARRFEAAHRSISVRLTDYRFSDLNPLLRRTIGTAGAPDLAYISPRQPGIPTYARARALVDLTAAARAHHWFSALRPGSLAAYNAPFRFAGGRAGAVLAVSTEIAGVGVLVNLRLLARLHLRVPGSLQAFAAALATAHRARYTGLGIGNEDGWPGDDLFSTLVNAQAGRAAAVAEQRLDPRFSFRAPPYLRAATIIRQWADAGYLTEDLAANDAQESIDLFFQGQTLFQLVSTSQDSQIAHAQQTTHLPIGIVAFPGARGRVTLQSGYLGWVVPAASKHRAEAIQFISYLLSPATAAFLAQQQRLPAHAGNLSPRGAPAWQRQVARTVMSAHPGIYLDAAPMPNLQAAMESIIQSLLHRRIAPDVAVSALQHVYATRGSGSGGMEVTGEF